MVNFMKKWQVLFLAVVFILGLTLAGCSQKQLQSKPGTTAVYKATDIRGKELSFQRNRNISSVPTFLQMKYCLIWFLMIVLPGWTGGCMTRNFPVP